WLVAAVHFALLPFSISADWPPLFFSVLAFCQSFTSLNPVMNLYFDPALRNVARSYFWGREKQRRIGSVASTTAGTSTAPGTTTFRQYGKKQQHLASRVSHFDAGVQEGEKERRAADAESRAALKLQLFGKDAAAPDKEEERALQLGRELVLEIERDMTPMKQSNQLVKLWSGKRGLKATITVRASADDVAAFLHDYESAYFNEAADKDQMVRDRFKIEDLGGRSHATYSRVRMPRGRYRDRVVCSKNTVSAKNHAGAVMYVSFPTVRDDAPEEDNNVRVSCIWVFRIKPWEASAGATVRTRASARRGKVSLELYSQVDFKTKESRMELEELRRPLTVRAVSQVQRYFQHLRLPEDLDA
ncbi:hypothetical protein TeGR_g7087, partial [Tetraparma gracilis]